jgi:hypothetical protein
MSITAVLLPFVSYLLILPGRMINEYKAVGGVRIDRRSGSIQRRPAPEWHSELDTPYNLRMLRKR